MEHKPHFQTQTKYSYKSCTSSVSLTQPVTNDQRDHNLQQLASPFSQRRSSLYHLIYPKSQSLNQIPIHSVTKSATFLDQFNGHQNPDAKTASTLIPFTEQTWKWRI